MENKKQGREIIFKIRRYNPNNGARPYWQDYTLFVKPGMTVLDGLHEIKGTQDASLAMRFSCRMGVCGSCAMMINGKPSLACNTQILDGARTVLAVAPLPNFDIVKDLVPDLMPLFKKHRDIGPHIEREDEGEMKDPTGEFYQSPEELVEYLQYTYCIKCGACMSACPTMATDQHYLGPMPLTQAHRYSTDSRDNGFKFRKEVVGAVHGAFRCHYGGECSRVCPKGVDPARAIQHMKRNLVLEYLRLLKTRPPCKLLGKPEHAERRPDIPDPPAFTVKQK